MQLSMLFKKVSENPEWARENITSFPINSLKINDDGSQVRASGICSSHVEELVEDLVIRGQQVPITVDQNYNVIEGNHRVKAFKTLMRRNPDVAKWQMINVWKREFSSDIEVRQYQLKCNKHLPSKASTNKDYALAVTDDLKDGKYPGMTWKSFNLNAKNFEVLVDSVKVDHCLNGNRAKSVVKVATKDAPNQKLKNYTKDELIEYFQAKNDIGWSGNRSGEESNGSAVYAVGQESHIFPNLTGNAFKKKTSNGKKISNVCLVWETNTHGKDEKKLDKYRQTVVKKINEANASWLLSKEAVLVDEVYIAAQKLRGTSKENTRKFFKVSKDSNGRFNLSSIPAKGWK